MLQRLSKDSTLLGAAQWKWLEEQLNMPADIRIIGSSTQFGVEFNGYESWANFPNEQKKMLDLIDKTQAGGVIFLSGDVHYSEMSRIKRDGTYPIYDFTSSGITSTWHFATPNKNRIEGPVMDNHFGLMTINWNPGQTTIKMECIDVHNNQRFEYTIPLNSIQPGLE
jgi:alkaline phosphatase D